MIAFQHQPLLQALAGAAIGLAANGEEGNGPVEQKVKAEVAELCARFPMYPKL